MNELRSRRAFLRVLLAAPAPFLLAACGDQASPEPTAAPSAAPTTAAQATAAPPTAAPPTAAPTAPQATAVPPTVAPTPAPAATEAPVAALPPTPQCADDDEPTIAQTEGPYYTPNSPERASLLEAGMAGTKLVLAGSVLTTGCQPVAGALVDIWHCDDAGVYDNAGYRLRGHQFADDQGRYQFETILPGVYPGRTRHIHVKVQAPGGPILTTQLYFPDEPGNSRDGIFSPELLVALADSADGLAAGFNFVLG